MASEWKWAVAPHDGQPSDGQPVTASSTHGERRRPDPATQQKQANLVFIFDDGYQSIMSAASYLHQNGMAGNVSVIGEYVDHPTQGHLNLYQLKALQNNWGWDMVNHTQQHTDAVIPSYACSTRADMRKILQQAAWLRRMASIPRPTGSSIRHGIRTQRLRGCRPILYVRTHRCRPILTPTRTEILLPSG